MQEDNSIQCMHGVAIIYNVCTDRECKASCCKLLFIALQQKGLRRTIYDVSEKVISHDYQFFFRECSRLFYYAFLVQRSAIIFFHPSKKSPKEIFDKKNIGSFLSFD